MKRLNKSFGKMFFWTYFRVPTPWQQLRDKIDTWSSILVHAVESLTRANAKRRLSCFDWVVWKNRTFRPLWYESFSFYLSGIHKEQRSDLKISLCWMNGKYWNDLWLSSSLVYAARLLIHQQVGSQSGFWCHCWMNTWRDYKEIQR